MNPPPIPLTILAPLLAALAAIGPFTIDTYLPAFPEMMQDLNASQLDIQQSLTAFLLPFALMALWHGAISDALGRRPVVIVSLIIFLLGSLAAAFATTIEHLWLARAVQGISAGAGMVVSRAVVRDILEGAAAHRVMAQGAMMFALAPAVAPITGGWLLAAFGWRSIFVFLALYAGLLILAILRWLPETLPPEKRQSLHPVHLARSYAQVFSNPAFLGQSGALAANFLGFFLYVLSAPVFLMTHLGVSAQGFAWLFVPTVTGMMLGSWWSSRLAGKLSPVGCVRLSFGIMLTAATVNVVFNTFFAAQLPWSVLPIMLYTFGMAIGTPALQLLIIDLYPKQRGLVASCQAFMQSSGNVLGAALLAPLLWASTLQLAAGMACLVGLGLLLFLFGHRLRASHPVS
jgi:MFS transporter, DHA1 family, multidrug resistance protein